MGVGKTEGPQFSTCVGKHVLGMLSSLSLLPDGGLPRSYFCLLWGSTSALILIYLYEIVHQVLYRHFRTGEDLKQWRVYAGLLSEG